MFSKSNYQAPKGIAEDPIDPLDQVEFDIEDDSGMAVVEIEVADESFDENLAEKMDEGDLSELGTELAGLVDQDIMSRADWEKTFIKGLEVLVCATKSAQSRGLGLVGCSVQFWPRRPSASSQRASWRPSPQLGP